MNPAERLATIVAALDSVGVACLVMGGHAVRYYGLERHTNDFDLTVAPDGWNDLADRLSRTCLFEAAGPIEGNSWRPGAFRRFLLRAPSIGQEEWLEFWRENHLLAPFPDLHARREVGAYGGRELSFLGLPDLIRSKETERAKDWEDVFYLEEFLDLRRHASLVAGKLDMVDGLSRLRSRRGFDTYLAENRFADTELASRALERASNPISQAFLLPWTPDSVVVTPSDAMEGIVEQKLRSVEPASTLHLSLVEVVRRRYKVVCQELDRADKEAIRSAQSKGPTQL